MKHIAERKHVMKKEEYGNKFNEHLIEQYKLYVQMADNISSRRSQTNAFFISVLSALLVFLSLASDGKQSSNILNIAYIAMAILGLLICGVWFVNIQSYKQLNSGKYKVIHEIEQQLPFPCYDREWDILGQGGDSKNYLPITHIERYIPLLMSVPFLLVLVYLVYKLLTI
jgi:hypothetical protein